MADRIAKVSFVADTEKFQNGIKQAQSSVQKFEAKLNKFVLPAAAALGGLAAAGIEFSKAAAEDQKAAALLADALKTNTGATDAAIASTEKWITKTSIATATADDELRPALATLARTTGDVTKSQELLTVALDVAAATGKPLESVTSALSKAYAGNFTALNRLVPGLIDTSNKSLTFAQAMDQLKAKTQGAAEVAANNDPYKQLTIAIDEAKEAIGAGLLPILKPFIAKLVDAATWVQNNSNTVLILAGILGGFAAAIIAVKIALEAYQAALVIVRVATTVWTGVQWALNAALTANPIGLVVVAIGALVAALVVAYNKSETFRDIVTGAFDAVKRAVEGLIGWFGRLFDAVKRAVDLIVNSPIGKAVSGIISGFRASGGPVRAGGSYVVGEAGPELFVPNRSGYIIPNGVGTGSGTTINISVSGALDPVGVANQIKRLLNQNDVRLGLS